VGPVLLARSLISCSAVVPLRDMRFTQTCPECLRPFFYDTSEQVTLETTALGGGRCRITTRDSSGYVIVVHECLDRGDGGSPVLARPPRRPPGRIQSAQRDPGDDS
jgi:hypothetical protein